jgi:hypothetical protein
MTRYLFAAFMLGLFACSGNNEPAGQAEFSRALAEVRQHYDAASDSGNDVKKQEAEHQAEVFLRKTLQRADDWVGVVESVSAHPAMSVTLTHRDHEYRLVMVDPRAIQYAATLNAGDGVVFSGDMGVERSMTIRGGLREPEFEFAPERLRRQQETAFIVQDAKLMAQYVADQQQALIDGLIRDAVVTACQDKVRSMLKHGNNADFSLLKQQANKLSPKIWIYYNQFEAQNDFGAMIAHQYKCTAAIEYANDWFTIGDTQIALIN